MTTYHPVALEQEIPENSSKAVEIQGKKLVLVRMSGGLHAVENRCTHMGVSFTEGPLENGELVCPWHSARFCARSGEHRAGPGMCSLERFPVRVVNGAVEIGLDPAATRPHPLMGKRAAACLNQTSTA